MEMSVKRPDRRPGWWIPFIFVGFFLTVLTANGIMVFLAMDTWTGLHTEDHYRKGLSYNDALAGVRAQQARGWQVSVAFAAAPGRHADIDVILHDADGEALTGAEVQATLIRPTHAGADLAVPLAEGRDGHYRAAVELPLPGVWDLRVFARHPAGDYQTETQRVWVKE